MTGQNSNDNLILMTTEIVAAHLNNNAVETGDIPSVIETVYQTLLGLGQGVMASRAGAGAKPEAAVPVKKSITPDYIVCLEDGKKLKMLKRHLRTAYNMTPEQYRQRWSLPADYPMVAPNYAKKRSKLAKEIGLGTKGGRGRGRPAKAVVSGVKRGPGRPRKAA